MSTRPTARRLPLHIRQLHHADGRAEASAHVPCARRGQLVALKSCEACADGRGVRTEAGDAVFSCVAPPGESLAVAVVALVPRRTDVFDADLPARAALAQLRGRGAERAAVVDVSGRLVGVVNATTWARHALEAETNPDTTVGAIASPPPAAVLDETPVRRLAERMARDRVGEVAVVTCDGAVVGLVDALDVLSSSALREGAHPPPSAPRAVAAGVGQTSLVGEAERETTDPLTSAAPAASAQGVVIVGAESADGVHGLVGALAAHGWRATSATTLSALGAALRREPDAVVVLGRRLGEVRGHDVLRWIRGRPEANPRRVLVVVDDDPLDRVVALELGADDVVAQGASERELRLRVRNLSRRGPLAAEPGTGTVGEILRWQGIELDRGRHVAQVDGQPLRLRPMEHRLLERLLERPGQVCSRAALHAALWPDEPEVAPRTVDTHVRRLRDALGVHQALLETVHGFGYRLRAGPPPATAASAADEG